MTAEGAFFVLDAAADYFLIAATIYCAALVADDLRAGRLVAPLPELAHPGRRLFAVYPESRHLSPKVRAMIDWLVEEFGPDPSWDRGLLVEGLGR
jgi:DNA-binding transcriptional LysR family regulator